MAPLLRRSLTVADIRRLVHALFEAARALTYVYRRLVLAPLRLDALKQTPTDVTPSPNVQPTRSCTLIRSPAKRPWAPSRCGSKRLRGAGRDVPGYSRQTSPGGFSDDGGLAALQRLRRCLQLSECDSSVVGGNPLVPIRHEAGEPKA